MPVPFTGAAEGTLDGVVLRRVAAEVGIEIPTVFGQRGIQGVLASLRGYNASAAHQPWFVLFDLDTEACAPALLAKVLPRPARFMCCRVAVRMVDAWLLGDRQRLAGWLNAPISAVAADPEALVSPKQAIVTAARASRSPTIRDEMVPAPTAASSQTGPAYNARLIAFVVDPDRGWRPETARHVVASLDRAMRCLEDISRRYADFLEAAAENG